MNVDPRRSASKIPPSEVTIQSEVTAEDIERAKAAAERDGTPLLNAMLNARSDAGA